MKSRLNPAITCKISLSFCMSLMWSGLIIAQPHLTHSCGPLSSAILSYAQKMYNSSAADWASLNHNPPGQYTRHGVSVLAQGPFLIVSRPFNWQGTWQSVWLVPLQHQKKAATALLSGKRPHHGRMLAQDMWQHPFIATLDQHTVVVNPGPPYAALGPWNVYTPDGQTCTVDFGVPDMPFHEQKFLSQFIKTLEEILGHDPHYITSFARKRAYHDVLIAAMRPWVLEKKKVRSIKDHLARWARQSTHNKTLFRRLNHLHPHAHAELTQYYEHTFHMPPHHANALSQKALEIIIWSFFDFSSPTRSR